jgi:hypothetical protein
MLNIGILITFGLAQPALAFAIGVTMVSQIYFEELFTGRFLLLTSRSNENRIPSDVLQAIEDASYSIWRFPRHAVWVVVTVSACFYAIAAFDISSDQVKPVTACIICFVPFFLSFLIWSSGKFRYIQRIVECTYARPLREWMLCGFNAKETKNLDIIVSTANPIVDSRTSIEVSETPRAVVCGVPRFVQSSSEESGISE